MYNPLRKKRRQGKERKKRQVMKCIIQLEVRKTMGIKRIETYDIKLYSKEGKNKQ